jgi:hypothetical protein
MSFIKKRLEKNLAKIQNLLSLARTNGFLSKNGVLSYVKDVLSEIFGYQKNEIISDLNTDFFDIALTIDEKIVYMIKCFPIDVNLERIYEFYNSSEEEIKYCAANKINWIIFTNGIKWYTLAISFNKNGHNVENFPYHSVDILSISYTSEDDIDEYDIESIAIIAKEGVKTSYRRKVLLDRELGLLNDMRYCNREQNSASSLGMFGFGMYVSQL